MMKLNKIQNQIYEEYKRKGKVWAECPRQVGKTELILFVAEEELKKGNKICLKSFSVMNFNRILERLRKQLGKNYRKYSSNIVGDDRNADITLYDELYYDLLIPRKNQKVVCLRTPLHKTLRFSYMDMEEEMKKYVSQLRKQITKEQFDIEFNNYDKKILSTIHKLPKGDYMIVLKGANQEDCKKFANSLKTKKSNNQIFVVNEEYYKNIKIDKEILKFAFDVIDKRRVKEAIDKLKRIPSKTAEQDERDVYFNKALFDLKKELKL